MGASPACNICCNDCAARPHCYRVLDMDSAEERKRLFEIARARSRSRVRSREDQDAVGAEDADKSPFSGLRTDETIEERLVREHLNATEAAQQSARRAAENYARRKRRRHMMCETLRRAEAEKKSEDSTLAPSSPPSEVPDSAEGVRLRGVEFKDDTVNVAEKALLNSERVLI
eukprot:CAMPEP_0194530716 /NCGR_PEP_ID=MMETSP0253-20130528/67765_1 /TAXON_ID=2966 /ORGANISM="Noctiluca scintillans" /LENGTH=172 /DNA_ID=CAMNT_0039375985 /DNA_START=35 /DNA_END=553 /DNA_ORIENTATION=+